MTPVRKDAHLREGPKRSGKPQRYDRLDAIMTLLDRAWHLNATGHHTNQWVIARHLVAAAASAQKAQRRHKARTRSVPGGIARIEIRCPDCGRWTSDAEYVVHRRDCHPT